MYVSPSDQRHLQYASNASVSQLKFPLDVNFRREYLFNSIVGTSAKLPHSMTSHARSLHVDFPPEVYVCSRFGSYRSPTTSLTT